jgi:hypothetical protein
MVVVINGIVFNITFPKEKENEKDSRNIEDIGDKV